MRRRVVVAGLGDSGILTAIRLARDTDVVGISAKPALVSGQELGIRLSRPEDWARDYWIGFERFRGLDRVRTVHGRLTGVDLDARQVSVEFDDGSSGTEDYDALVISTGVANGFWRRPTLQSTADIGADLRAAHDRLARADSVIVVGGGAAAVSSAANLAGTWPAKRVDLYYPGERPLPAHHARVWGRIRRRLTDLGVGLHGGHRAVVPHGFACDEISTGPVQWSTGQEPASADAVLWAIGRVTPNTDWLPSELLDDDGFVRVTPELRVPGLPGRVRDRRRRRHRPASQLGPQQGRRPAGQQHPRGVRRQAAAELSRADSAVGFGAGSPTGRTGGVRPERSGVPVPRVVDRSNSAAADRPQGHLQGCAITIR